MKLQSQSHGNIELITLPRQLVMANAQETRAAILELIDNGRTRVVLDLEPEMPEPLVRAPRPGDKFIHVIEGILQIELGEERFVLRRGDSIHFKASHPFRLLNLGDQVCRVFWADWPRITTCWIASRLIAMFIA